jgi:anti-sigma factor RsiW
VISSGCRAVQVSLARFVDGVLAPDRAEAINRHLEVCADCLEAARTARAIPLMLSSPAHPMVPPTLLGGVMEQVDRLRRRNHRWLMAIAAAAVLVLAGGGMAAARP